MSNGIQNKLSQFEAMPPAKVWDAIAAELDTVHLPFAQQLGSYEVTPPSAVWNRIVSELDLVATPAKVLPFYQRHNKLLRYGSMAAAILAAVFIFNLFSHKAVSDNVSLLPTVHQAQKTDTSPVTITESPATAKTTTPELSVNNSTPEIQHDAIASAKILPNRYVTMANNDGKTVRLSKKVYPVIDCAVKTEESTWSKCKENIQAMQAKMSASVGAGDFGGLIDMIKSLEEKQ